MRCEECSTLLDDFVEGELGETACGETAAHLAACAACAHLHEELKQEQAVYVQYLLDVEPSPRLWPFLRANIEREKAARAAHPLHRIREGLSSVFAASPIGAALAALVLGFGLWLTFGPPAAIEANVSAPPQAAPQAVADAARPSATNAEGASVVAVRRVPDRATVEAAPARVTTRERGVRTRRASWFVAGARKFPPAAARPPLAKGEQAQAALVGRAEKEYLKAISMLSRDADRRRAKMSADDRAQCEKALSMIDRTIAETRVAARNQPGDPQAAHFMLAAYAKKVDVLQEIAGY